ncbi:MAG: Txe/YoeB family addiction module toxin [Clostridiales Family XIII bacterium]|jgi:toxin YoeB|nr:Txe/YoeB family addiction module toxin [Clostridiales Family XIII bacterium]
MEKLWTDRAWDEYISWQSEDKKTIKKINTLIRDIERGGNEGIGEPEALKYGLTGWWSRKIDDKNRIVYRIEAGTLEIAQCKGHYSDK